MLLKNLHRSFRIALVTIALFLIFDFSALALNFWLSAKIEKQAIAINLAGRQRMLSQRMVKALLQMEDAQQHHAALPRHMDELRLTLTLFDETLLGFDHGHQTRGGNNQPIYLEAVNGPSARRVVSAATNIWQPYKLLVEQTLNAKPETLDQKLEPALQYAKDHNLELLDLMNQLTTELESQTQEEAIRIRWFQGMAFALALLNFFGAFALYLRRLSEISRSHGLLDNIINKVSICVLVIGKNRRILRANPTAERIFGHAADAFLKMKLDEIVDESGSENYGIRADGSRFVAAFEESEIAIDDSTVSIITITDITQQRKTEAHLSTLAYHDVLTSLPNRLLFDDRLNLEIAHALRDSTMVGVLFIDLDHFKPVNDRHGHETGDKLLQAIATRLKLTLREGDTVSRHGGDEFTVILPRIGNREACDKVATSIIEQLCMPFHFDHLEIGVGASIGISLFPEDGLDAQALISRADDAMYLAKQAGRNTFRHYVSPNRTSDT